MVLSETLRVFLFLLLGLCLRGSEAQGVDLNALARIINHIQTNYCPTQGNQFAVAINVPAQYCTQNSNLKDGNFLKQDNPRDAIKDMKGNNKVYNGKQLIGATRRQSNNGGNLHSEYLLLNGDEDEDTPSPMQTLLGKDKNGCVVFYTYNSPCTGTCLSDSDRSILEDLDIFNDHSGPKAFVYNKIFNNDNFDLVEYTIKIDEKVKLYRCFLDHNHKPDRSSNNNRDRPSTSERDRSRSPINSNSNPYECHPCFNEEKENDVCLDTSL